MSMSDILQKYGAVHVKNLIPKELCNFLTHVLLRAAQKENIEAYGERSIRKFDVQVPSAKIVVHHDLVFETVLERVWPDIELVVGEDLLPTYAYSRLYSNGDILERHTDRPACEISVTIQLGRSHHYSWPIYMGKNRYDLAEGDAVIYKGCDIEHWRNQCDGPNDYYSGQVFVHFVRKNGDFTEHAGDAKTRNASINFEKYRSFVMENK